MRKGLTTLLTVAIAMIGSQAMALAPTISDIPSPIVGGNPTGLATQATKFVYPDAFNLDLLVSDDQTTPTSLLKWTYEEVGSTYLINGIKPINSASQDPATIADSFTINRAPDRGTGWTGSNKEVPAITSIPLNRVTIRNNRCLPIDKGTVTSGLATGFFDIQPITFWCSDGNAASSQTVLFYTDNYASGLNRLSQPVRNWTYVNKETFFNTSWPVSEGFYGACTTHTWGASGTGVCFEVAKTGQNWGSVASPMGFLSLSANTLYRIRATMNCSQISPGHTPFWDMVVENAFDAVTKKGLNLYSMDQIFLDNVGGANAVVSSTSGTVLTMYFTPAAVSTTQFNDSKTGLFSTAYSANKDARIRFRVLDVDSNTALLNDQKYGAICLQSIVIDSLPMSKVTTGASIYTVNTTTQGVGFRRNTNTIVDPKDSTKRIPDPKNNVEVSSINGASILFPSSGGYLQLTPTNTAGGGKDVEIVTITPANDTSASTLADNWPIPWTSNKIYELDVTVTAPNPDGAAHPFDVMWLNMESPTNEVNCENVITSVKAIASPKYNASSTYKMFYNTFNESAIGSSAYHFLRYRVRFGNNTTLNFPNPSDKDNIGGVRITSIQILPVTLPN